MSNQARIHTKLTADGSELTRALQQGVSQASGFKGQMLNIGKAIGAAFTVQAVVQFGQAIVEFSDEILDVAGSLNISTSSLQAFDAVARKSLADVDGFRAGMKKLAEVQADAAAGNVTAQKSFDKLGLGADGYKADLDVVVKALADYYAKTNDMAVVQDLFGKQAVKSREALLEIANTALPELVKAMDNAGLIVGQNGLEIAAKFDNMWKEITFRAKKYGVDLVEDFNYTMEAFKLGFRYNFDDKYMDRLIQAQRTKDPARLATPMEKIERDTDAARKAAAEKELADSIAAYQEEKNNIAYAEELRRVEEIKRNKIKSIEDAWRRDNELAEQAAKQAQDRAFDWQMRMFEMDREAATSPESAQARQYSQLRSIGLAAKDIGAAREVKTNEAKMLAVEEKQLAALNMVKAAIEKLQIGKF